jgi:type I restriction-modification system DNA methylase subunit
VTLMDIRVEGGLVSPDLLERLDALEGQKPTDFGLPSRRTVVDEVAAIWSVARTYWQAFQARLERQASESLTTITREQWMIPLLDALGYAPEYQRQAAQLEDGRSYALSHRADAGEDAPPLHIVACDQELGSRPPSGRGNLAPHSLLQDYLNRSEHLWGVVTNGVKFRLLRDSAYFSRPSYIEFDLESILRDDRFDEFVLFYRLAHRSRLPKGVDDASDCLLERYHQAAVEQGGRIRDGLRNAVREALLILGTGFLNHRKNEELRRRLRDGALTSDRFYLQLLYLVYRFLFLMVAEERGLLASESPTQECQRKESLYDTYFGVSRLRRLADEPLNAPERFNDLYFGLQTLFRVFSDETFAGMLGLTALNGELFSEMKTAELNAACLDNDSLLKAVRELSYFTPKDQNIRRRVNYSALDVEELGSVYESLLDEKPWVPIDSPSPLAGEGRGEGARPLRFDFVRGTERKTTGSYYTRPDLVKELVESALVPVMRERLAAAETAEAKEKALLSLKVCDPACGSGHFLLAAGRRIGRELAIVRTGDDEPSPDATRDAIRDAITHCLYGVDKNPLAVDLCKVALWIEGHHRSRPLAFLDHRIRWGDSLVGVFDMDVLNDGIPDDAYDPATGDDKLTARAFKSANRNQRRDLETGQLRIRFQPQEEVLRFGLNALEVGDISDDTPRAVHEKRVRWEETRRDPAWERDKRACDLWTAAFFTTFALEKRQVIPTTEALLTHLAGRPLRGDLIGTVNATSSALRFFHWHLEFPEVFAEGGFDVVLSNPPWERIKLQEEEFFATRNPRIAEAANKSARQRLIQELARSNPALLGEYEAEKHNADALSKFLRKGERFPLTAVGDINTYAVFAEHSRRLLNANGRAGIIVPTGIATDDTCKRFFSDLNAKRALASLYDFENREALFSEVHRSYKFCLLTMSGKLTPQGEFAFFLTRTEHLQDDRRRFPLSPEDLALINPNTRTCPVFRTQADAELTKKIYCRVPVLVNETTGENPWGMRPPTRIFDMNKTSVLDLCITEPFETYGIWVPIYEGKMMHQFDHRWAMYSDFENIYDCASESKRDPTFTPRPRYWIPQEELESLLVEYKHRWMLVFRDFTNSTRERTFIATILPFCGTDFTLRVLLTGRGAADCCCVLGNFNSVPLDYVARQCVGGTHMADYITKQLPVFPVSSYNVTDLRFIVPRVLELVYTSWDMAPFAADVWNDADDALSERLLEQHEANRAATGGHPDAPPEWADVDYPFPPFKWDDDRRAVLRAELDAYYARLYGLVDEELRYILDPKDVYSEDFPGETFRVLKEKEIRQFGEYRTRRLVLEAWSLQR